MSTSEKWTVTRRCPCGTGKVLEHIDSPDNPWSATTRSYELLCSKCAQEWTIEGGFLQGRSTAAESKRLDIDKLPIES